MAMKQSTGKRVGVTVVAWVVAFLIFFPILWTFITSFKSEIDAIAMPPKFLFFNWTLENYSEVQERSNYLQFAFNSIVLSIGANVVGLLIAVPAAWSMAFAPGKRTKDLLMWMLSTKMMPAVGVLVPIYLIFRDLHLLDSLFGVGVVLMLINLPLLVWMLYTYFKEIPVDILEAARMDGASLMNEIVYVLTPMAVPGIASTMLLAVILSWNEAFWTLNLTTSNAAPLTGLHRLLLGAGRLLLGEALGGLDARHRADPHPRLVLAEAARARPDLRRREVSRQRENATMGSIQLKSVNKAFGAVNVINGVDLDIKRRRVRGVRRTVGLRQVDASATDRRPRGRHLGRDSDRRQGRHRRRPVEARARDGVPVLRALSAHERARQHRLRAQDGRPERRRDRAEGDEGRGDAEPRPTISTASRASSPAASASASPSAARSCASRRRSCSTSRCPTSTRRCACRCGSRSANCTTTSRRR